MNKGVWSIGPTLILALILAACGPQAADDGTGAAPAQTATNADPLAGSVPVMGPQRHILAFGDSLFAGYGVGQEASYPAQLQNALRARGINAVIGNAGVSGDTSAAGLARLAFALDAQEQEPDLVILELGGNDLLRGLSPDETRANLAAMLVELQRRKIAVLIMGMRAPPNYGPEYQAQFDALYGDLSREYNAALVPFWLESIYQKPDLFQADRIHPTKDGIETLVGATVEQVAGAIPPVGAET
ncbi:MAG: arylesterase [Erythrobacter sp. RIFCSPHIGHO2_12_FULL_63_10]|nr:MAG: arylesterase [Erythrobacter sp. RIFCSPHIGHO2_12_FULL_63_10]